MDVTECVGGLESWDVRGLNVEEDLACDVASQTEDGFAASLALGEATGEIVRRARVPAKASYDDSVESCVRLPVTSGFRRREACVADLAVRDGAIG